MDFSLAFWKRIRELGILPLSQNVSKSSSRLYTYSEEVYFEPTLPDDDSDDDGYDATYSKSNLRSSPQSWSLQAEELR